MPEYSELDKTIDNNENFTIPEVLNLRDEVVGLIQQLEIEKQQPDNSQDTERQLQGALVQIAQYQELIRTANNILDYSDRSPEEIIEELKDLLPIIP